MSTTQKQKTAAPDHGSRGGGGQDTSAMVAEAAAMLDRLSAQGEKVNESVAETEDESIDAILRRCGC